MHQGWCIGIAGSRHDPPENDDDVISLDGFGQFAIDNACRIGKERGTRRQTAPGDGRKAVGSPQIGFSAENIRELPLC